MFIVVILVEKIPSLRELTETKLFYFGFNRLMDLELRGDPEIRSLGTTFFASRTATTIPFTFALCWRSPKNLNASDVTLDAVAWTFPPITFRSSTRGMTSTPDIDLSLEIFFVFRRYNKIVSLFDSLCQIRRLT